MDTQLLCLGVLSGGEHSGYEIKKLFECRFSHFFAAGFGSIYPALAALAQDGRVTVRDVPQAGRPDKRVYRITPTGLDHLRGALARMEPRHKVRSEFCVLMYFAHLLPPGRAIAHLEAMIAHWRSMLDGDLNPSSADAAALTPGQRFDLGFGQRMIATAIAYCTEQRDALEQAFAAPRDDRAAE